MRGAYVGAHEREAMAQTTPAHEADVMFGLVLRGVETLESARALIAIPPHTLALLNAFAAEGGCTAQRLVYASVEFRAATMRQFNCLVRDHGLEAGVAYFHTESTNPDTALAVSIH